MGAELLSNTFLTTFLPFRNNIGVNDTNEILAFHLIKQLYQWISALTYHLNSFSGTRITSLSHRLSQLNRWMQKSASILKVFQDVNDCLQPGKKMSKCKIIIKQCYSMLHY